MSRGSLRGVVAVLAGSWLTAARAQYAAVGLNSGTRILVRVSINGRPLRMALDTGAGLPMGIWQTTADSLGLPWALPSPEEALPPGSVQAGLSDPCDIVIEGQTNSNSPVPVIRIPEASGPDIDGVVGWPAFRAHSWRFSRGKYIALDLLSMDGVESTPGMMRFDILADRDVLVLENPALGTAKDHELIQIDTGGQDGVSLRAEDWKHWADTHPQRPRAIYAYYMPAVGLRVTELAWADRITVGGLTLTEVPVMRESDATSVAHPGCVARVGMLALLRASLIVDGSRSTAYLAPSDAPAGPFAYSRLGAVFVPAHGFQGELVAKVLSGGPADRAGIRDGDVLLAVNGKDATHWEELAPDARPSHYFEMPAGTQLDLVLQRDGRELRMRVILEELLRANPPAPRSPGSAT